MRTRLYLDPKTLEKYHNNDFPTIRQILEEIRNKGNIDIFLFSETKDKKLFKDFIKKYYLEGLIKGIKFGCTSIGNGSTYDIVADDRNEIVKLATHLHIKHSLTEVLKWFVPQSQLLDPVWCLINSGSFIQDMERTMDIIECTKMYMLGKVPDYLAVEEIYVDLFKKLLADKSLVTAENGQYYCIRLSDGRFSFNYKG